MKRRNFIKNTAVSGMALTGLATATGAYGSETVSSNSAKFKLKYAPGLGTFRESAGSDPIDNIKFIADQGFTAVFDNGLAWREAAVQEKIGNELARLGMDLGPFIVYADHGKKYMVTNDTEVKEMLKQKTTEALEVQKRTGAKTGLITPGLYDERMDLDYQTINVIENMRLCCDIAGKTGLELVMEPLNRQVDHPGLFLTSMPQSKMICVAVNHPSCKIVDDLYHQQITEGNLIRNMDLCWDYIGAFHIGDNPGRNEPTTGEINYKNIFKHIYDKGYQGTLCCEHGKSKGGKEGEMALIQAYREVDSFEV
ncbi:hydroxypyruvate isomerase [Tangfeifania diversioriginum]|uniref:Hydroxypyruvate isomerase n=1 Tax=Tangfeifania diversioriginum TaxID=1168035 RepID=A0A1M6IMP8_9BACT|nr:TIM barrel protein [Tangfeifania diversioriginum]SHJ35781.1 hydroxypyruvate isomerase [Tangfeifania diversioriginum]